MPSVRGQSDKGAKKRLVADLVQCNLDGIPGGGKTKTLAVVDDASLEETIEELAR